MLMEAALKKIQDNKGIGSRVSQQRS